MSDTLDQRAPSSDVDTALDGVEESLDRVEEEMEQLDLELPDDHGRIPSGMRVRFKGTGDTTRGSHAAGERVVFLVEGVRGDASHKQTKKFGLLYDEAFAIEALYEVDRDSGRDLLAGMRQQYRVQDDAERGVTPLFDGPVPRRIVWADESGYVLSAEDLAQIRGEEPAPASDEELAAAEDVEAHEQLVAPQWLRAVEDGDTAGYDKLTAPQVIAAAKVIDERSVIIACSKHEASEKNRAGVRKMLDARLEELSKDGD